MNTVEIGMRLKKQRQLMHLTREELAEMVNITPRFCYDLELGNKKMSVDTLCKMHETLQVSTDYLLCLNTDDSHYDNILALVKSCPKDKLEALTEIISIFVHSIQ